MMEDLRELFKNLDDTYLRALRGLSGHPMRLGFSVLEIAEKNGFGPQLTAQMISISLVSAGISKKPEQITNAFKKAGERLNVEKVDGETWYSLMHKGREELGALFEDNPLTLYRFEPGNPFTGKTKLAALFQAQQGEIYLLDPYYGVKSLETLALLPKKQITHFLTGDLSRGESTFATRLNDFKREYPNVVLRRLPNWRSEIHDRYLITKDNLILLGHGIKDIGDKESFIVSISKELAPDLIKQQIDLFKDRWARAEDL